MFRASLLLFGFALCASASPAFAAPRYDCPGLHDARRRTLAEMSQGREGWFFRISSDLRQDYFLSSETAGYLRRLNQALAKRGMTLVFLSIPPRGIVARDYLDPSQPGQKDYDAGAAREGYHQLLAELRKTGMLVPDLLDVAESSPGDAPFYFHRDHHWTPEGARRTAEAVAKLLEEQKGFERGEDRYTTKDAGTRDMKFMMALEIQRLCASEIVPETLHMHRTERARATGEQAHFGEAGGGTLALVGTSFSAEEQLFNFPGFLSQATGWEVANYALSSGRMFNAFLSLASSPRFEEARFPFLLWEMSGTYDLNVGTDSYFRQLIPAVEGTCGESEAVAAAAVEIQEGKTTTLFRIPAGKAISGKEYYLVLDISNKGLAKFTLQFDHADKDGEWFIVDRSKHFKNDGRFFVELSDEIETPLVKVILGGLPDVDATVKARLCLAKGR